MSWKKMLDSYEKKTQKTQKDSKILNNSNIHSWIASVVQEILDSNNNILLEQSKKTKSNKTKKPTIQSKNTKTKINPAPIKRKNINSQFTLENIQYLNEIYNLSPFSDALYRRTTFKQQHFAVNIRNNHNANLDSINNLFTLDIAESKHIYHNKNMYYKLESCDIPLSEIIESIFSIKQKYKNESAKKLIKSHINEFLVSQKLELEILSDVEICYNIFMSAKVLVSLSVYNTDINVIDLESIFNQLMPKVLKQNARAIMESKFNELEKRKDSINTAIETIKLNNEFENYLKNKGSEILQNLN
ncbi:hypothetical protein [Helicobacter saguini]|uniref:Uncharacterized protein n=1 Tax=Helicobacter saguini TaxID=1548018 RepID=A0A6L7DDZ2_9HELI|nr:hypothetical protein [Helicobacter saguini]MWV62242.1 hypothetical protein [Helicobacter saguini]MWV69435.1 hypothetical protein [Helicobacter saguini]MWV71012.1 hypothetical protein [Helicobacter saguini]